MKTKPVDQDHSSGHLSGRTETAQKATVPPRQQAHTPGPWHWENAVKAVDGSFVRSNAFLSPGVLMTHNHGSISDADARLIAAAPALLEALVALTKAALGATRIEGGYVEAGVIDQAEAALALAREGKE